MFMDGVIVENRVDGFAGGDLAFDGVGEARAKRLSAGRSALGPKGFDSR
jgi:hypothetical protein